MVWVFRCEFCQGVTTISIMISFACSLAIIASKAIRLSMADKISILVLTPSIKFDQCHVRQSTVNPAIWNEYLPLKFPTGVLSASR